MVARGRKRRSSQADLEMAVEAVVAGASYKAAEEMTGVSRSTVRDYVVRSGVVRHSVPRRGRKRKLSSDADVMRALVEMAKGASQRQAARAARVGESTLRRCLLGERVQMPRVHKRRAGSLTFSSSAYLFAAESDILLILTSEI